MLAMASAQPQEVPSPQEGRSATAGRQNSIWPDRLYWRSHFAVEAMDYGVAASAAHRCCW